MSHRRVLAAAAALLVSAPLAVAATAQDAPPHVVVYSGTQGFRHISISHAKEVLTDLARDGGYTVEFTEDARFLTASTLERADVVLWLSNTAGSGRVSPFTDEQEQAYGRWMQCGGGHVGIHAAVDSYSQQAFPEYYAVTGATFAGHPLTATSILDDQTPEQEGWGEPEAEISVTDKTSPMTRPWAAKDTFRARDEYYKLDRDPGTVVRDYRKLLSFERFTDPQGVLVGAVVPGDYGDGALAWTGSFQGRNRSFYTNLGHSVVTWDRGDFQRHVVAGLRWVAEPGVDDECVGTGTGPTR